MKKKNNKKTYSLQTVKIHPYLLNTPNLKKSIKV